MSIKYWILYFLFSLLPFFSLAQSKGAVYSFSITQSSITDALRQVEKETGTSIAFSPRFFNPNQRRNFQFKQKTLSEILNELLKDQLVEYSIISGQIVISRVKKPNYSLYGYLSDGQSGERLLYANIWCPKLGIGTTTNEHGYFSLTLPEGKYTFELSHTGFQTENLELEFTKDTRFNIQLTPIITLTEVVVTPEKQVLKSIPPGGLSGLNIRTDDYSANPDFGGETDVLRACSLLPGIHSGDNGMGGLHVRGGDTDQNLVLLDGVPVYNSGHIFHLFSIFNNEIVQNTRVLKGGFPSRYGGRISSVMDVRTRDGNLNKWRASAGIGLMSANATVEGPLKQGESSILVSARRTHLDYLLQPYTLGTLGSRLLNGNSFQDTSGLTANSQFFDINTKIRLKLGNNDQLFTSFYFGKDLFRDKYEYKAEEFEEELESKIFWGNTILALRWNHVRSQNSFFNTTLTFTNYQYQYEQLVETYSRDREEEQYIFQGQLSDIRDLNLNWDLDYVPNPRHYLRTGFGGTFHLLTPNAKVFENDPREHLEPHFNFSVDDFKDSLNQSASTLGLSYFAYVEDEWNPFDGMDVTFGLRASGFYRQSSNFFNLEPRLIIRRALGKKVAVSASVTKMVQYLHQYSAFPINLPESAWIPPDRALLPQSSWLKTIGLQIQGEQYWVWQVEGYHKSITNELIQHTPYNFMTGEDILSGQGRSYGFETFLKKGGKTGGQMNYTLAWAERRMNQTDATWFPFQFDQRHAFKIQFYHFISKKWRLDMNWILGSGIPILPVYDINTFNQVQGVENLEKLVFERSPNNHQLNIGVQYSIERERWNHTLKLGVTNVYNQRNVAYYKIIISPDGTFRSDPVSLIGILPSIYYRIQF